jgi:hypothetical protein
MNLCRGCGQDFSSVKTFDRHRVGGHEYLWSPERPNGRRCLSVSEIQGLGWTLNKWGRWLDPSQAFRGPERGTPDVREAA